MAGLEYGIIHLSNGATLYTADEVRMKEDVLDQKAEVLTFVGLDGEKYDVLKSAIVFTNYSTPAAREKLNDLKFALQTEQAEHQERMLQVFIKRRDEENERKQAEAAQQHEMELAEQRVARVSDRLIRNRPQLET